MRPTARVVDEALSDLEVPFWEHPEWAREFPWLLAGATGRGRDAEGFDLRLFGGPTGAEVEARWARLGDALGFTGITVSRQVHEARIHVHDAARTGLVIAESGDGHVTRAPDLLMAVTVADCVPVYLVDPAERVAALLHAGWRGVAAGILEGALDALRASFSIAPDRLRLHLGPSICGQCYEVGPEVFEAVGLSAPEGPEPIDLRSVLVERAVAAGVPADAITVSGHCTLCSGGGFFSHRGGDAGRQVAILGVRAGGGRGG